MIFHPLQNKKKYTLNITANGCQIEQVSKFEYLGTMLQENLHWDAHINTICSKISSISGVLNRMGNTVDRSTLTSIYYAHVNSHLSYVAPIWGFAATDTLLNSLQVAQNQSLRSLFRSDYYANGLSTDDIRKKYAILSVRQNIRYNTAMLAYKMRNSLVKTDVQINLINQRHSYSTRGASDVLQGSFRTNSGKYMTSRTVAIEFNKLPINVRNCQSIYTFKKHAKAFILNS